MGRMLKIKCNGNGKHINEIDVENALRTTPITKEINVSEYPTYPERIVLKCRFCADGKVIITKQILEDSEGENTE